MVKMKKYEYMMEIDRLRRSYENGDITTSTCQLNISDIIMRAWNDSKINGRDMEEILLHTNALFIEIAKRVELYK